jgi:hypothetical protein
LGPLFQLIIVGILYFIVASILGLALMLIARLIMLLKKNNDISVKQLFWLPLTLAPYFLLAIIVNILVCDFVRDVDSPLTDYWSLPINNELSLGAIDTTDKWYLWPSREGGEALISNVVLVGISDKALYGLTESDEYFIYRFDSNQKVFNLSKDEFDIEANKVENSLPKLKRPSDLYYDNRDFGDLITFLLLMLYPLYRFYNVCNTFWILVNKQNIGSISTAT